METVPQWRLAGDWFDVCSCDIPCPCEFAQAPTNNVCQGVLAYKIREGQYGDIELADLNLVLLGLFEGNIWSGQAKSTLVGPSQVATWGRGTASRFEGFGFDWEGVGTSSKHIPFAWSGPDAA